MSSALLKTSRKSQISFKTNQIQIRHFTFFNKICKIIRFPFNVRSDSVSGLAFDSRLHISPHRRIPLNTKNLFTKTLYSRSSILCHRSLSGTNNLKCKNGVLFRCSNLERIFLVQSEIGWMLNEHNAEALITEMCLMITLKLIWFRSVDCKLCRN